MFFLDSEHVGMAGMLSSRKVVRFFLLYAGFLKVILVGYHFFFVGAIIRYVAKVNI